MVGKDAVLVRSGNRAKRSDRASPSDKAPSAVQRSTQPITVPMVGSTFEQLEALEAADCTSSANTRLNSVADTDVAAAGDRREQQ